MTAPTSEAVSSRKNRWHQSTLSTLLDGCSWQYFLTYVLELDTGIKPYAITGTAYHSAIETHEKNRMKNIQTTQEEMNEVAIEYIKEQIKDELQIEELSKNCLSAIDNWYNKGHRDWLLNYTPVSIEPEFTLPLVDNARPIGGYIDAIYRDTNGVYFIVDHKTAKDFSRWRNDEGHRYQAAMYSAALVLSEDFPDITELPEMVYMVTRTQTSTRKDFEPVRTIRVQPNLDDVKLLGDRIRLAEYKVENVLYETKTDWPLCSAKWCPFFEGCQVTGELSGEPNLLQIKMRQQLEVVSQIEEEK
jgi:hypothetical protein